MTLDPTKLAGVRSADMNVVISRLREEAAYLDRCQGAHSPKAKALAAKDIRAACDEIERLEAERAEQWRLRRDAQSNHDVTKAVLLETQSEAARWRARAEGLEEVASEVLAPFAAHELEAARLQPDAKPVSDRFKIAVPAGSLRKLRAALSTQTQGGGENG